MGFQFLLWICIAASADIVYRKCFNWIVLSGFVMAIFTLVIQPEAHPLNINLIDRLVGSLAAFFIFLFFYKSKLMGAGDVKFAAALGVLLGWRLLLPVWMLSSLFAVVHGVVAGYGFRYFGFFRVEGQRTKGSKFIPYVTYLSLATVIVLLWEK